VRGGERALTDDANDAYERQGLRGNVDGVHALGQSGTAARRQRSHSGGPDIELMLEQDPRRRGYRIHGSRTQQHDARSGNGVKAVCGRDMLS
jgi:hypothetical protein